MTKPLLMLALLSLLLAGCNDQSGGNGGVPRGPEADFYRDQKMNNPGGL